MSDRGKGIGVCQRLVEEDHCGAFVGLEADAFVEGLLVGGHEVDSLNAANVGVTEDGFDKFATEANALVVGVDDDIPDGGAVDAVGGSAGEADEAIVVPHADDGLAVGEGNFEVAERSILCPESGEVEEFLKLSEVNAIGVVAKLDVATIHI